MHKIRGLARKGSGRVVSGSGTAAAPKANYPPKRRATTDAFDQQGDAAPGLPTASSSTNALASFGRKIFRGGDKHKHRSLDLLGAYGSRRRVSGGTSLMDMQVYYSPKEMDVEVPEVIVTASTPPHAAATIAQDVGRYSIESSPPTPPIPGAFPQSPSLSPSPSVFPMPPTNDYFSTQIRNDYLSAPLPDGYFSTPTLKSVDDIDIVVRHGDYARQNRRRPRREGPVCPPAADVFVEEETVKLNRRVTRDALMAKEEQQVEEMIVVEDEDFEDQNLFDVAPIFKQVTSSISHKAVAFEYSGRRAEKIAETPAQIDGTNWQLLSSSKTVPCSLFVATPQLDEVTTTAPEVIESWLVKREKRPLPILRGTVRPPRPWKFRDAARLPSVDEADRIARTVQWIADVNDANTESLATCYVGEDFQHIIEPPAPYVPYWHAHY